MTFIPNQEYLVKHAIDVIKATYGDDVSVEAKNKDLLKFGRSKQVQTTKSTLMTLPTGVYNETYVSTNIIDTVSSSSASDTEIITVEGHTISGGVFTFVTQNATLNGQSKVVLETSLARVSRMFNTGSNDLVGDIYCYEDDTITAGVPSTGTKVHCMIENGLNNSEKASTTISNNDYWVVTEFYGDCLEKVNTFGILHFEIREAGSVFRNKIDLSCNDTSAANHEFHPYIIVPKNADVRLRVSSSSANDDYSGGIEGVLLKVV
jgi:hypothetical protein